MGEIYQKCREKKFKEKNYSLWEKILLQDQEDFLNQMVVKYLERHGRRKRAGRTGGVLEDRR